MIPRYILNLSTLSKLSSAILTSIVCFYVIVAPFTKVEESFNLQATHDILFHGYHIDQYDHIEFPGVVPRTFLGPLLLSSILYPFKTITAILQIISNYSPHKFAYQIASRLILGILSILSITQLQSTIQKRFGSTVSTLFIIITCIQFHLPFYMSRPLPNTFALMLSCIGIANWIDKRPKQALAWLTFAAVIIRCDVILLAGLIGIHLLITRQITLIRGVMVGIVTAVIGLMVTVPIDSFFWQRWVWPEGEVLWFNTALNKSSEWGISPPLWYFTSALPRALHAAYPLAFIGALMDRRVRPLMFVAVGFVALYSNLGHKELRFLFPVLPLWNICAAAAVVKLWNAGRMRMISRLIVLSLFGAGMLTVMLTAAASSLNYPGGIAIQRLHAIGKDRAMHALKSNQSIRVHIDVLPAMTGVSRFCEKGLPWVYSKQEGLTVHQLKEAGFDYLLSGHSSVPGYKVVDVVDGFSGIGLKRGMSLKGNLMEFLETKQLPVEMKVSPVIYVHESL